MSLDPAFYVHCVLILVAAILLRAICYFFPGCSYLEFTKGASFHSDIATKSEECTCLCFSHQFILTLDCIMKKKLQWILTSVLIIMQNITQNNVIFSNVLYLYDLFIFIFRSRTTCLCDYWFACQVRASFTNMLVIASFFTILFGLRESQCAIWTCLIIVFFLLYLMHIWL